MWVEWDTDEDTTVKSWIFRKNLGSFQEEELLIALKSHSFLKRNTQKFSRKDVGSAAINSFLPSVNSSKFVAQFFKAVKVKTGCNL